MVVVTREEAPRVDVTTVGILISATAIVRPSVTDQRRILKCKTSQTEITYCTKSLHETPVTVVFPIVRPLSNRTVKVLLVIPAVRAA